MHSAWAEEKRRREAGEGHAGPARGRKWPQSPLWGVGGGCAGLRVFTAPEEVSLQPQGAELEKHSWAGEEDLPILKLHANVSEDPVTWMGWPGLPLQSRNTGHVTKLRVTGSNYSKITEVISKLNVKTFFSLVRLTHTRREAKGI